MCQLKISIISPPPADRNMLMLEKGWALAALHLRLCLPLLGLIASAFGSGLARYTLDAMI